MRVRLWSRSAQALGAAAARPHDQRSWPRDGRGKARLARATTDLAEALAGAEVVIAPLPATSHDDLATRLAPHVDPRQIILLTPGTLGSYAMARALARAGAALPYALAETGTLPYLARKTGPAAVSAPVRAANLPLGVFPASRTERHARASGRALSVRPAVRRRARRRADERGAGDSSAARAPERGPDRRRALRHSRGRDHAERPPPDRRGRRASGSRRGRAGDIRPPHYELATYYDEARAAEGPLRRRRAGEARRERSLERDPHVRAPVRDRGRGPRSDAARVRRPRGRDGDPGDLGTPADLRRAARPRALRTRPRARAPGARRLQPPRDPRVPARGLGVHRCGRRCCADPDPAPPS